LIPLPASEPLPRIDKIPSGQWTWQTLQRSLNVPSLVRIDMNSEEQWNWDVLKAILETIVNPSKDLEFSVVVSYMNRFFGLLVGNDTTRDCQFVKKWYDRIHKRNVILSLNERKLAVHTENKTVMYFDDRRQQKYMSVVDIWRKHSDRAEYSSIVYNPRPAGHCNASKIDEINTYTGLRWSDAECKAAYEDPVNRENLQFYLQHGQRIICNGNTDYWTYLHKWQSSSIKYNSPIHGLYNALCGCTFGFLVGNNLGFGPNFSGATRAQIFRAPHTFCAQKSNPNLNIHRVISAKATCQSFIRKINYKFVYCQAQAIYLFGIITTCWYFSIIGLIFTSKQITNISIRENNSADQQQHPIHCIDADPSRMKYTLVFGATCTPISCSLV